MAKRLVNSKNEITKAEVGLSYDNKLVEEIVGYIKTVLVNQCVVKCPEIKDLIELQEDVAKRVLELFTPDTVMPKSGEVRRSRK